MGFTPPSASSRNLYRMTKKANVALEVIGRRGALQKVGLGIAAVPMLGCSGMQLVMGDAGSANDGSATDADGTDASGIDAASAPDASSSNDAASETDAGRDAAAATDAGPSEWAAGGTAAMVAMASYPSPFAGAGGSSCSLTVGATLGPCYYTSPVRRDVSEGYTGLPVRLALRVVDETCTPIEGARVEIWHTRNSGLYSGGPTSMCTSGDADALAHLYFRGGQTTDADGVVGFDTCLPGWYRGRAVHIHFQVFLDGGASATVVSQLFFSQELLTSIFATHADYASFGQPDTPNASDGIYRGVGDGGLVETERMSDGAMLAWKQIVVRG